MKSTNDKIDGDIVIDIKFQLNGMVTGNITVTSGGYKVYGVIIGGLFKEAGETYVEENAVIKNQS